MKRAIIGMVGALAIVVSLASPRTASAHPLGNFTINRYSRIELAAGQVHLRYVLDMAEIPTFQEMSAIDRNGDGRVDDGERERYLRQKVDSLRRGLRLTVNASLVDLRPGPQELSFPPGQGGLQTLRVVADFAGPFHAAQSGPQQLDYGDDNYADRLGWKEIVIRAQEGVSIARSSVSANDRTAELTAYPNDMLSSPLDQREAHATFDLVAATSSSTSPLPSLASARQAVIDRSKDAFAELVATQELSLPVVLLSLLVAFGLGALHALSPGHGKTVVGAYLVGSRGTARHALFLGTTVTLTHTAGVFALGVITLFASQFILPEKLYPWLSLISGVLVVAIGLSLFARRLRAFLAGRPLADHHPHAHDDAGPHHHHGHSHTHAHPHPLAPQEKGEKGEGLSWRNLLALGISGGLLPCPSALVVLLSAISLHRVGFGLLLIVAFSAGLAGVLTVIGLLLVYAGRLFSRMPAPGRLVQVMPIGSALVVAALGTAISLQALVQAGVLRL